MSCRDEKYYGALYAVRQKLSDGTIVINGLGHAIAQLDTSGSIYFLPPGTLAWVIQKNNGTVPNGLPLLLVI